MKQQQHSQQYQSGGRNSMNEKSRVNKPSSLLSAEENDKVYSLLGRKCQTQSTAVVQLYTTESPAHSQWIKRHTGALCFVKDSSKRSYFCRLYCLTRNELVWEQELYDDIEILRPRPYLLTFEGHNSVIALNFASDDETNSFFHTANTIAVSRRKRREEKRHSNSSVRRDPPARPPPAAAPTVVNKVNNNNFSNDVIDNSVQIRNPPKPLNSYSTNNNYTPYPPQSLPFDRNKQKGGKRKLTKADISNPTDFKHVSHVGWNAQSGFDLSGEEEDLKPFLQKAGVSQDQMKDRKTREFIYDFIQNHNVLDTVHQEKDIVNNQPNITSAPPPVPSRSQRERERERERDQNGSQRTAPPPPPTRHPPPQIPHNLPPVRNPAPTRPPPITNTNSSASLATPPPPPPPPPPIMVPPPPPPPMMGPMGGNSLKANNESSASDPRSALMDSIKKGKSLKPVEQGSTGSGGGNSGDSRNDLLSEIRQGKELKPASSRELNPESNRVSSNSVAGTDELADALRRALQERGRFIQSSDEDDNDDEDDDNDWDE